MAQTSSTTEHPPEGDGAAALVARISVLPPFEAAALLKGESPAAAAAALTRLPVAVAVEMMEQLAAGPRAAIAAAAGKRGEQWIRQLGYEEGSVGRLMEPPAAMFGPDVLVEDATARLREMVKSTFITYAFVVDPDGRLVGVMTFRELLFAQPGQRLRDIMVANPFSVRADLKVIDAMREVVTKHFPVYPVCDESGRLIGEVRGTSLFAQQAFEISAQAGSMVGVEKEERLGTSWTRSLKMRHPWLQLNLVTAFVAAAVVGVFEDTIGQLVVLAVFLPVLAGQSGNTGCQALAVTLRGMTLGELRRGSERLLVAKEALLGLVNGGLVGIVAGAGMFLYARNAGAENPMLLGLVVVIAMIGSCVISGISGAIIPLALRRLGADPATASSIFLTTATDVASMGMFLGLATMLLL